MVWQYVRCVVYVVMLSWCATDTAFAAYERTIVFMHIQTDLGENVFMRGGSTVAIPIRQHSHPVLKNSAPYLWSVGDHYLDWNGAESGQGTVNGVQAGGTPMTWTTYVQGSPNVHHDGYGYTPENWFGTHLWMLDIDMECSNTDSGWFDFKTYITPTRGWETDIAQMHACGGDVGGKAVHSSQNHNARCGKLNIFYEDNNGCIIATIPTVLPPPMPTDSCGHRHSLTNRIVHGHPAAQGNWPWMLEILYKGGHGCGASLISPTWAVTAAHCVRTATPFGAWGAIVRAAELSRHDFNGHEGDYFVKRIIKHPLFDKATVGAARTDNDIALIELLYPIKSKSNYVETVCLPDGLAEDAFVGKDCWAVGWGSTKGTGDHLLLQEAKMPVKSAAECKASYGSEVSDRQVCAGGSGAFPCSGDSGSPLSCHMNGKWYLVGAVSWGDDNCVGRPGVFTRISAHMDWIKQTIGLDQHAPVLIG